MNYLFHPSHYKYLTYSSKEIAHCCFKPKKNQQSKHNLNYFIDNEDNQFWSFNGNLHREDGPAAIYNDGAQYWYLNGLLHREDGPAVIHPDGVQFWYVNGELHREDGPAIILIDREEYWCRGSRSKVVHKTL